MEKYYLSFGAGVNSTAILALIHSGKLYYPNLRIVFADTGCEKSSTYCHIQEMQRYFNIEVVKSDLASSLYDFCWQHNCVPHILFRWCTSKFKLQPISRWKQEIGYDDAIAIIGFCEGEEGRTQRTHKLGEEIYPLIELGFNRDDCKRIIRESGWAIPEKSGCFICPFQRKNEWIAMMLNNKELWDKAVALEDNSNTTFRVDKIKLKDWLKDDKNQVRLVEFEGYQHCICMID